METLKFVMTTTFYPPYHIGGDAIHVYYLANELAKRNHEVHVINLLDSYFFKRKNKPKNEYKNHDNVILHSIKSPFGIFSIGRSYVFGESKYINRKIKTILEGIKPDVLHHHNIAGFGPSILNYASFKTFYTAHDYWLLCPMVNLMKKDGSLCNGYFSCFACPLSYKRPPQIWRYRSNANSILDKVDTIIAPSAYMKKRLLDFGIRKKIEVISNFILDTETKGENPYDFSYFLFIGVIERYKGVLDLVKIYASIKEQINAKLMIVGTGSLNEKLHRIIKDIDSDKIKFLGRFFNYSELANLYKNALAVVIPSICPENNPYVAIEALANCTPIIVSNIGGLPEIAEKGNMPIFNSSQELISCLKMMEKGQVKYKNPKKIYEEFYSPNSFITRYFHLIKK